MSPILPPNERSEAVGSDRRDLTVMGPPPRSGKSLQLLGIIDTKVPN